MGICFRARDKHAKLNQAAATKITDGHNFVNPSEYFSAMAQTISKIPATTKIIQAILTSANRYYGLISLIEQ
jgi:hypothetical protein